MPSFRAIIKYKNRYPNEAILLMSIGAALGIKYPNATGTGASEVSKDKLKSLEGMNVQVVSKEEFKKDLDLLNAPSNY